MDQRSPTRQTEPGTASASLSFAEQAPAIGALAALISAVGHLPRATVEVSHHASHEVTISLFTTGAWEEWREALRIPPEMVDLRSEPTTLEASTMFCGVRVRLTGYGPQVPQACTPAGGAR